MNTNTRHNPPDNAREEYAALRYDGNLEADMAQRERRRRNARLIFRGVALSGLAAAALLVVGLAAVWIVVDHAARARTPGLPTGVSLSAPALPSLPSFSISMDGLPPMQASPVSLPPLPSLDIGPIPVGSDQPGVNRSNKEQSS